MSALLWLRLSLLTLLTGVALIGAGLGGPVGGASQSLAHKLAAHAQALQRSGPAPVGSRSVRGEPSTSGASLGISLGGRHSAAVLLAGDPPVDGAHATWGRAEVDLSVGPQHRPTALRGLRAERPAAPADAAPSGEDWRAPPGRAPPHQA
ncbi:MAG: hypothetical protein MUE35_12265 [Hydrogenophaga sp.]|nr:hypothetical protein [Hydrogenophaga sp.]